MIGTKFYKNAWTDQTAKQYAAAAEWCNANMGRIEDKGDCYEVVAIPEPTLEELKAAKRTELLAARDAAIRDGTTWQGHPIWTDGDAQRLAPVGHGRADAGSRRRQSRDGAVPHVDVQGRFCDPAGRGVCDRPVPDDPDLRDGHVQHGGGTADAGGRRAERR